MKHREQGWSIVIVLVPSIACVLAALASEPQEGDKDRARAAVQAAVANPQDRAAVDAFVRSLPEFPPGSGRYIVEGDISINRAEVADYLRGLSEKPKRELKPGELIVNLGPGGEFDYWKDPDLRHIKYAVDRASFGSNADEIEGFLHQAMKDWTDACPKCGISFEEAAIADATPGGDVLFVVRYENVPGGPIARSFFPSSAPIDRTLSVFPAFFSPSMSFDKAGVFRHELGHILGYRHEHIVGVPGCATEGSDWVTITPYTPNSVMHYFCGGRGSFDLSLRTSDVEGHRCLYLTGKPCPKADH